MLDLDGLDGLFHARDRRRTTAPPHTASKVASTKAAPAALPPPLPMEVLAHRSPEIQPSAPAEVAIQPSRPRAKRQLVAIASAAAALALIVAGTALVSQMGEGANNSNRAPFSPATVESAPAPLPAVAAHEPTPAPPGAARDHGAETTATHPVEAPRSRASIEAEAATQAPKEPDPASQHGRDVRLPFHFSFNGVRAAPLAPADVTALDEMLGELAKRCADRGLELTGHSDSHGSERANKIVGLGRAIHVRAVLRTHPNLPAPILVGTAGSSQPIASNETRAGQEENRRVSATCARRETSSKEPRP